MDSDPQDRMDTAMGGTGLEPMLTACKAVDRRSAPNPPRPTQPRNVPISRDFPEAAKAEAHAAPAAPAQTRPKPDQPEEVWKSLLPFGIDGYEVSSLGRVRSYRVKGHLHLRHIRPKTMRLPIGQDGYKQVRPRTDDGRTTAQVHRLVCLAFHGQPPTDDHHASHIDGDKNNNAATSLRWESRSENERRKRDHGTAVLGEASPFARLTEEQVLAIRAEKTATGRSNISLGKQYGVSNVTIGKIVRRKGWTHI